MGGTKKKKKKKSGGGGGGKRERTVTRAEEIGGTVIGLMSSLEAEEDEKEHAVEIERYRARNAILGAQIARLEKSELVERKEMMMREKSAMIEKLVAENDVIERDLRLEKDCLDAAYAANAARATERIADCEARCVAARNKLTTLKNFESRKKQISRELQEISERLEESTRIHRLELEELRQLRQSTAERFERETRFRELHSRDQLRRKVEDDMSTKYHVVQTEHGRIKAELAYQARRIQILEVENTNMKKKNADLAAACEKERRNQETISRSVQYHHRAQQERLVEGKS